MVPFAIAVRGCDLMRMASHLPAVHMGPNDGRDLVHGLFAWRHEPRRVVG